VAPSVNGAAKILRGLGHYPALSRWGALAALVYFAGAAFSFGWASAISNNGSSVSDRALVQAFVMSAAELITPAPAVAGLLAGSYAEAAIAQLGEDLRYNFIVFVVIGLLLNGIAQLLRAATHGASSIAGKRLDGIGKSAGVLGWSLGITGTVAFRLEDGPEDTPLIGWAVSLVLLPPLIVFFVSILTPDIVREIREKFYDAPKGVWVRRFSKIGRLNSRRQDPILMSPIDGESILAMELGPYDYATDMLENAYAAAWNARLNTSNHPSVVSWRRQMGEKSPLNADELPRSLYAEFNDVFDPRIGFALIIDPDPLLVSLSSKLQTAIQIRSAAVSKYERDFFSEIQARVRTLGYNVKVVIVDDPYHADLDWELIDDLVREAAKNTARPGLTPPESWD